MTADQSIVNLAAYRFAALSDLEDRREELRRLTHELQLRGTILLAPEGINLFIAGSRTATDTLLTKLRADPPLSDLTVKESLSDYQPFNRMLVKIKKEIISFGIEGVDPLQDTSPKLSAVELKQWLDEGRTVHLLDVRNDYEVEVGTFENAIPAHIDNFREFPDAVRALPDSMKEEPVVMFCTGGIRCEKAGPYMEQAGFQQIYQLDGGILKYFEDCGSDHYDGDCFVFDQRVAVNAALQETGFSQCYVCQAVVSPAEQETGEYVPGKSCPQCWQAPEEALEDRLSRRCQRLAEVTTPLPGSRPYFNRRPLNVPARYDGWRLLDFLTDWHPHVDRKTWQQKIAASNVIPSPRYGRKRRRMVSPEEQLPLSPDRLVRGGERLEHLLPGTVEPNVRNDVQFLYEDDDLLVINKPAPLPLHPGGRFNRNTLQWMLSKVYAPQHPLLVHRLDANTTGVLVLARKRSAARVLQKQFEQRTVQKQYTVKVHGSPAHDTLECTAPISRAPGVSGVREILDEGLAACTKFHVIERDGDTTILNAIPVTGRTNQIRLHLWYLGFPVVGDPVWQPDGSVRENTTLPVTAPPMCLHASSISLMNLKGDQQTFTAALPESWNA